MSKNSSGAELAQTKQMLEVAFKTLKVSYGFQPGMLVRWKQGMKNKKLPAYGEPVIVVEVLPTPVFDKRSSLQSESPLFNEPLDLVLGFFCGSEEGFHLFYYDSRRFEQFI